MKTYAVVFFSVFLAELGDKTQIATLLYAADPGTSKGGVFVAAAGALVLSTLLAVTIGSEVGRWIGPRLLKTVAGLGFLAVGLWVLLTR
jgi:putative Ca2+/H+ antiporter (TMEM165/GDT1 family)